MFRRIAIALALSFQGGFWAQATDVYIFTENFPPYNFRGEDGTVSGYSTDLVRMVMDESGLDYSITVAPWTRGIRFTETGHNTLIYSIARMPEREKRFTWLFPLASDDFHLFARTGDKRNLSMEAVKNGSLRVVCTAMDMSCQLLDWVGIPKTSIVKSTDVDRLAGLKLVEAGRVDLFPGGIYDYHLGIVQQGFARDTFRPVIDLDIQITLYLAGGMGLRPEYAEAIMNAYRRLEKAGKYKMMSVDGADIRN